MYRTVVIACILCLALLAACTKQAPQKQPAPANQNPSSAQPATTPRSQNRDIAWAQDRLDKNDMKGAIKILEGLAKSQNPMSDELKRELVNAHLKYVQQLSTMRTAPLDLLNQVMYNHAARILELEPDHPEARADREASLTYFREHQKTPPAQIDPLIFLDDLMNQGGAAPQAGGPAASGPSGSGN